MPKPENSKLMECRWLYKIKEGSALGEPPRYKAKMAAKGYIQRGCIDFTEIFSSVLKFKIIRLMLSMVAYYDLELEQLDFKTTLLHGDLEEIIYMSQPEGFINKKHHGHIFC